MPFEKWNVGEDLFSSLDKEHDLLDRDLRPFVEEADQMQAIQLMTSVDDAWGGFASRYMDLLRDEYGKTAIWIWGIEDGIRGTPRVSDFPFHGPIVDPVVPDQFYDQHQTVPACCILTYSLGQTISQTLEHRTVHIREFITSITVYSHGSATESLTTLCQC